MNQQMNQQINLYQPIFRKERRLFSALAIAQLCAVAAVALGAFAVYAQQRVGALDEQVTQLRAQEAARVSQLQSLSRRLAESGGDEALQARLAEAVLALRDRESVLGMLAGAGVGSVNGFSHHLEALARRRLDGLWLTSVSLSGTDGNVRLEGRAADAALVPEYLQQLAAEVPFGGQRFASFQLSRPEAEAAGIRFTLSGETRDEAVLLRTADGSRR